MILSALYLKLKKHHSCYKFDLYERKENKWIEENR